MSQPVNIVTVLWEHAEQLVAPPQFCLVVVSDPPGTGTGTLAFRHNSATLSDVTAALRELADKLDAGEARSHLSLVSTATAKAPDDA